MWLDTWADSEESPCVAELHPRGSLNNFYGGISSGLPLASHSDLPGSQSIYGASQDPPMCVNTSLSQDGSYCKGLWVEHPLTWLSFGFQGTFSAPCVVGEVSWLREWEICGLCRVQPPPLIALLFLSWSFGQWTMNLQLLFPRGGRGHLPPTSGFHFGAMGFSLWWLLWWRSTGPGMLR